MRMVICVCGAMYFSKMIYQIIFVNYIYENMMVRTGDYYDKIIGF